MKLNRWGVDFPQTLPSPLSTSPTRLVYLLSPGRVNHYSKFLHIIYMKSYDMHVFGCLASFSQHYIYEFYPSPLLLLPLLSYLLGGNKVPIQRGNIWVDDLIGIFKKENMLFRLIQDLVHFSASLKSWHFKHPKRGKKFWISGLGFEEGIKERE